MNKITLSFLIIIFSNFAEAYEISDLPPFDYINIETRWSNYPNVYLDEIGNLRIRKYCGKPMLIDKRVNKEVFERASQSLLKLQFFSIPNNANLKYEKENGDIIPVNRECDHCPEIHVTFKYSGYVNSSRFEKLESEKPNVGYDDIEKILDPILKSIDNAMCEKNG